MLASLTRREAFALLREALAPPPSPAGTVATSDDLARLSQQTETAHELLGDPCAISQPLGVVASGDCLRPWIAHGDWLMADGAAQVRVGDLVVIESPIPLRAGFGTSARVLYVQSVKQLRRDYRGDLWLSSADGAFPVMGRTRDDSHRIVGPVRVVCRWPRNGRALPPLERMNFPWSVDRIPTEGRGAPAEFVPAPRAWARHHLAR